MKAIDTLEHFEPLEKLSQILRKKTQNTDADFFRILAAYYFTKVASMMRCNIDTADRGLVPINMYAINLGYSGLGKGTSTSIIEENVLSAFRAKFLASTLPQVADEHLRVLARKRCIRDDTDEEEELQKIQKEYKEAGEIAFSFDSGTTAAVKQMRHKLLLANAGSMSLELDEVGSNMFSNADLLTSFLELFDLGKIKQKLTKNTKENTRYEEIHGRTPTNMLLFGTPTKLLNGGKEEEEFDYMLETGFARRCFFGYIPKPASRLQMTAEDIYNMKTDVSITSYMEELQTKLGKLAGSTYFNKTLTITKAETILLIEYQLYCEELAEALPEHKSILKAELAHRHWKALKLAGTFAFIDGSTTVDESHIYNAIKLTEESGKAFEKLMHREPSYEKLAKFIASVDKPVTYVDLAEELPFFKGSASAKEDMLKHAKIFGYQNNIVIKHTVLDDIEFLSGETLEPTNTSELFLSYSTDIVSGYVHQKVPFDKLDKLTSKPGYHFVNHELIDGYRNEENCVPGFNCIVLDVDQGIDLDSAKLLLEDYSYHIYTTKRHTDKQNRFRIIMPISHIVKLEASEYKEFMQNIYAWLPFDVDTQTGQRSRKWLTNSGATHTNIGILVDAPKFIPRTKEADKQRSMINSQQSMSNIERWFARQWSGSQGRNNLLLKFGLLLADSGKSLQDIQDKLFYFNSKQNNPLDESEIISTVMLSVAKHLAVMQKSI